MGSRIYLAAAKVTDSVTYGFLPAAARLGLEVHVLTDRVAAHKQAYAAAAEPPAEVTECDVTDVRAIVSAMSRLGRADGIFSNSDHLQTPTALAAAYFGLPGKDWRAALHTKNKALMRRRLAELAVDFTFSVELGPADDPVALTTTWLPPYPLVVKPREGVASEDVVLVDDPAELVARCHEIRSRRPGDALVIEEFLTGDLHTLETLGDAQETTVLGGFATTLARRGLFATRLEWNGTPPRAHEVRRALAALGVGFGAAHTEYVISPEGAAKLIEVNYRIIGCHCDLLLDDLLATPVFEHTLRVHLGDPLPPAAPAPPLHAMIDYIIADRSGTLISAPDPVELVVDDVRVAYQHMRPIGVTIELAHSDRDFLGAIRAIGPDHDSIQAALRRFRASHQWEIRP